MAYSFDSFTAPVSRAMGLIVNELHHTVQDRKRYGVQGEWFDG